VKVKARVKEKLKVNVRFCYNTTFKRTKGTTFCVKTPYNFPPWGFHAFFTNSSTSAKSSAGFSSAWKGKDRHWSARVHTFGS
jgi:hypothetical protein